MTRTPGRAAGASRPLLPQRREHDTTSVRSLRPGLPSPPDLRHYPAAEATARAPFLTQLRCVGAEHTWMHRHVTPETAMLREGVPSRALLGRALPFLDAAAGPPARSVLAARSLLLPGTEALESRTQLQLARTQITRTHCGVHRGHSWPHMHVEPGNHICVYVHYWTTPCRIKHVPGPVLLRAMSALRLVARAARRVCTTLHTPHKIAGQGSAG